MRKRRASPACAILNKHDNPGADLLDARHQIAATLAVVDLKVQRR